MDPHAEVKVLAPKRRKCGPILSKTRSADEVAAHGIKMRELAAAEGVEVRPDFVVGCASVTVRRDQFAALQKLRREQERAAAWAAN